MFAQGSLVRRRRLPRRPLVDPNHVSILREAILSGGRVLVARVRCSVRCGVSLEVDDNHTGSGAHVTLTGSVDVGVSRKELRRGPLRVQIYVDTGPLIRGKTQLR